MKKLYKVLLLAFLLGQTFSFNAQITGTKTITIDYPTIQAAIVALNTTGLGAGGATIYVPAGYIETPTAPLVLTMTLNPSSNVKPLLFQKLGAGANPLITAFTPGVSTTIDGIFTLNGVDYVTIDGIDLQENVLNTTATMQMEWGYGLVKSSTVNGAQNNLIKNCTVTLNKANVNSVGIYLANHTSLINTALTISSVGGTSSSNKFYNNTVQNCYTGYAITGYGSAAPYDFYDQDNQIGVDGVSTRRSQVLNFGGAATTANGITATNQNGIKVFATYINNSGGAASTGAMNGIFLNTGTNSNVDIYADTLTLSLASVSGSNLFGINNAMGGTGAGNTINIYNCVVDGCTYATNTSGIFRGIVQSATGSYSNLYNNKVSNNTIPGTGEFAAIYYGGSNSSLVLNVNINNNSINNNTKTGAAGAFYQIFASANTYATNTYSNLGFNNSNATSSGPTYGYYNFAIGFNENVYNNQFNNNTGGSGETIMLFVSSGSGPTNKEIYGNAIYNISGNSTAGSVGAILEDYGTIVNVYKNNIYNITNNTPTGIVPAAYGINTSSNVNTQATVYNNFISDIKAPSANNVNAVYGIWMQGSANSVLSAYYNTVYLNATSAGANFGSAALVSTATPLTINLKNNILVNNSTPLGTGTTKALVRGSNIITNYNIYSGYNCLYAGVPGPANLIYFDGTNSLQTLQAFKNLTSPREQSSFSNIPPFVNVGVAPYDLHLQTGVPTQCEGGGTVIAGYATDYDANARNVSTPDVGADEINGTTVDVAAPNIQYTPLTNAGVAGTRNAPAFATITDPSGINVVIGTRPRLYYKKTTNANTYVDNLPGTDSWKYVEASNAGSPFNFTINYALLFGGGGVAAGDVIQYFVVAQDLAGSPIVGINSGGFNTQPTSVNLNAGNFPLNNTINQYTIVSNVYSGTINVGPADPITSLTNPGGIFALINAGALSGNLTINITGDLLAETGTNPLNQWAEEGAGGYSVSIVPSAAINRNIVGNNTTLSLIRFDGSDRVNIDGRFAGVGNFLTFRNTSNSAPTIGYVNDAQNNILQYAIVESGNASTGTALAGAVLIGTTSAMYGNDNITISNCDIRDRSDIVATSAIGINCVGTNGILSQYNNNCVISNNNIHDWFLLNSASQNGLNIGIGNSGFTVTGNSFYQTISRANTVTGAVTRGILISNAAAVNTNGGNLVSGNYIGGTLPLATGNDMTLTVVGAGVSQVFAGIVISSGLIPNSIQGNIIRKVDFTTNAPAAAASIWIGIQATQGIHSIGTLTGNIIGASTGTAINKITINTGGAVSAFIAGLLIAPISGYADIRNNVIGGITIGGSNTSGAVIPQWIQHQGTPVQTCTISNNLIGSLSTPNSIVNNVAAPIVGFAIRHVISSGAGLTVNSNTIQNVTDNSPSPSSGNYGILLVGSVGPSGAMNISDNVIKNLSCNSLPAGATLINMGMAFQGMAGTSHTISGNTISGIICSNTGFGAAYALGIQAQGNSFGATMSKNYISDIRNYNTGSSPGVVGVYFSAGLNWNLSNNMISVSNGTNTNDVFLHGIVDFFGQNANLTMNYNSIYVSGSVSVGANNSYAYNRPGSSTVLLKNNLFYNERAGGTGTHAAVSSSGANGWNSNASNYNAFIVNDTTRIGTWAGTTYNLTGWKTNSGTDYNSNRNISSVVTSTALFVNTPTGDLHINTSTYPGGLATPITVTVDIDGNTRSPNFPAVGADEIPCPSPFISVVSQTNVTCFGGSNGAAIITATGGATYTYSWAPVGGTLATAINLPAQTYTINVTNNCSLSSTQTVTITQPASISPVPSVTNVSCNSGSNAAISLSVTGGTGPYTYSWSPGGSTLSAINGLGIGTYTFLVTDANTCTVTNSVTITQPATLIATGTTSSACSTQSNGVVTVSVTGGTPVYSYSWSPNVSGTNTAVNLAPGSYSVLVTDQNSCTATQVFSIGTIASPSIIASTNTFACSGQSNGALSVTVSGGLPGYTYSWTPNVSATTTAVNLAGGSYTFMVTDQNNCSAIQAYTVSTSPSPTVSISPGNTVICIDEHVTLTASGAVSYSWAHGPTTGGVFVTPTVTTTYSVVGTGTNGCKSTAVITVSVNSCIGIFEQNNQLGSLNIYPNPGNGIFTITSNMAVAGTRLEVYNAVGQLIIKRNYSDASTVVNINNCANGIYFVRILSEDKLLGTARIVKE